MWWLLLPLACSGVLGYGGPPLSYDELTPAERAAVREAVGLAPLAPLPGREVLHFPKASLGPNVRERLKLPAHWQLVERIQPVRTVSVDDLEKLSRREQPPLEYAFPVEFREYDGPYQGRQEEAVAVPVAVSVPADADIAKEPAKGLASWLPQRVQSWLPSLPSLSSFIPHLPAYLPGFEFEAEVHRKPIRVPHIPSPAELVKDVNTVMDRALQRLHRKQEQLIELIKCTCPRPARCEGLFNEFLGRPSGGVAPAEAGEPSVSLFTEVTKPDGGHGASFGFFVDKEGPHLGHHVHNPNVAPASQTAPVAAAAPSSTPSSASAQSSAQAASSGDGAASATAQSSAQASGGGPASASALSAASASSGGS